MAVALNIEVVDSNIIVLIVIDLLLLDRLINLIVNLIVLWIDYYIFSVIFYVDRKINLEYCY